MPVERAPPRPPSGRPVRRPGEGPRPVPSRPVPSRAGPPGGCPSGLQAAAPQGSRRRSLISLATCPVAFTL
ncbi:hypothetical protein E0L36_01495 [Streptomyces sp. AJS327]|nr:hypothetical protein [Streptomyces sp. AJS327]